VIWQNGGLEQATARSAVSAVIALACTILVDARRRTPSIGLADRHCEITWFEELAQRISPDGWCCDGASRTSTSKAGRFESLRTRWDLLAALVGD